MPQNTTTPSFDPDAGYVLIDRQNTQNIAVVFADIDGAMDGLDSDPVVDSLAEEDALDVRLADHGNLANELAGREIVHT